MSRERATRYKSTKVSITIFRENGFKVTHLISKLDGYGDYEWIEIREALQQVESSSKADVECELNHLLNRGVHGPV